MPQKIDNLEALIAKEGFTVIDFTAVWCGPCQTIGPILHSLQDDGLLKLITVDVDINEPIARKWGIQVVPYLVFYKDGERCHNNVTIDGYEIMKDGLVRGSIPEHYIRQILNEI